ncbi:carboxypeptidase-like regulatory domain-containing protein [Pedobacter paludis]|uniref:Uncharacterized protein n=1 Tax=Pedobacter paludis TaxID=2203212 RepID=A0A317EWE9_9SPHI|nr:carboxypeptidase-like regulatory domain-containing protein [Pedobacter paludis]PWS31280.1 hypothetical protein DF947_11790 [Pedobacter paludis]
MKTKAMEITIAEPCKQDWDLMEKGDGYNFCLSCNKAVIDFSDYSNTDIIKLISNSSSTVCGRMSQSQLNQLNYHLMVMHTGRSWMKYFGVLAIGASIFVSDANASVVKYPIAIEKKFNDTKVDLKPITVKRIYGYVLDANKRPMAGIRLVIDNTKAFALTDKNGRYEIKLDQGFDPKNNFLYVDSARFSAELIVNYTREKQDNLVLLIQKPMIMGVIIAKPRS